MSWIDVEDYVQAVMFLLEQQDQKGPVNLVAPHPVTNRELTTTLGRVLKRPTLAPVPAFAARLAFGEMADEALLASTRVRPRRLEEAGFEFRYPTLESSLRHLLGRE
jgi:NAD dependent epimerase/dehydratase family enzyme